MARRIIPYPVYSHPSGPALPMDAPTLATRDHFGDTPAFAALDTRRLWSKVTAILAPFAGQGATFPAFPFVQPSNATSDTIKVNYGVAINRYSPTAHSNALSGKEPAKSLMPMQLIPGPQRGRRGTGGQFTIPNPLSAPNWPTSAEWLRKRSNKGIPTATPPPGNKAAPQYVLTGYDGV